MDIDMDNDTDMGGSDSRRESADNGGHGENGSHGGNGRNDGCARNGGKSSTLGDTPSPPPSPPPLSSSAVPSLLTPRSLHSAELGGGGVGEAAGSTISGGYPAGSSLLGTPRVIGDLKKGVDVVNFSETSRRNSLGPHRGPC